MPVCAECGYETRSVVECPACGKKFDIELGVTAPTEDKPSPAWKAFSAIVGIVVGTFVWYGTWPIYAGSFLGDWFGFVGVLAAWPAICGVFYGLLYLTYTP